MAKSFIYIPLLIVSVSSFGLKALTSLTADESTAAVPSAARFRKASGFALNSKRGAKLQAIDAALTEYETNLGTKSTVDKAEDLAVVTDRILEWFNTKVLDGNSLPTTGRLEAVQSLFDEVETERSRLEGILMQKVVAAPIAPNAAAFSHATVILGVTHINEIGAFESASATEETAARAQLPAPRRSRLGARLAMLRPGSTLPWGSPHKSSELSPVAPPSSLCTLKASGSSNVREPHFRGRTGLRCSAGCRRGVLPTPRGSWCQEP